MPSLKDVELKINAVKKTKQITKAMKMVAAAKLNRSQGKMLAARPYSHKLTKLVEHLAGAVGGGVNPCRVELEQALEVLTGVVDAQSVERDLGERGAGVEVIRI